MKSSTPDDIGYYLNYYDKSDFIQKEQYLAKSNPRKLFIPKIIWVILPRNKGSVLSNHICTHSFSTSKYKQHELI